MKDTTRRHELDVVRISAFLLLLFYHVSLMYGSRNFAIKAPDASANFDIIHILSHPWRMGLLFFISGVATAFALDRLSPSELRSRRSRQLLLPFILGIFFLIPPQAYVYFNATIGTPMSMVDVFSHYLTFSPFSFPDGSQALVFGMEHLWYLAYLWVYTAIAVTLVGVAKKRLAEIGDWLAFHLQGAGLLVWPTALFVLVRLTLRPLFPPTMNLGDDWYSHVMYLTFFAGGMILARKDEFWLQVARMRKAALIVALLCAPALLYQLSVTPLAHQDGWNSFITNLVVGPFRWCTIVAILGYAQALKSWHPPALQYLNRAVLSYYVLHQTLMLLIAYWLDGMGLFSVASFLPIVALTLGASALIYEGWRKLNVVIARSGPTGSIRSET